MNKGTLSGQPPGKGVTLRSLGDLDASPQTGIAGYGRTPSWNPKSQSFQMLRGVNFDARNSLFNPSGNLFKWRAAAGNARQGVSNAVVCVVGDSTSVGAGLANAIRVGYPVQLQTMMAARGYLTSSYEATWGGHAANTGGQTFADLESRVTLGTGWGLQSPLDGGGGGYTAPTSASGALTFVPTIPFDRVRVWMVLNSALFATVTVKVDGSSVGSTTAGVSGNSIGTNTYSTTLGTHTITLESPTGGSVGRTDVYGIDVWDSSKTGIRVFNKARGTTKAADHVVGSWDARATMAPHLTIINLALNDIETGLGETALSAYRTSMQSIINTGLLTGDVLLVTPNWTNGTSAGYGRSEAFHQACYDLAADNNLCLLDLRHRWSSYAAQTSAGLMVDSTHPSVAGYQDVAQAIFNIIT